MHDSGHAADTFLVLVALLALSGTALGFLTRRGRQRRVGRGPGAGTASYDDADRAHVALTGVPTDAVDLARHPVTGLVTERLRKPRRALTGEPAGDDTTNRTDPVPLPRVRHSADQNATSSENGPGAGRRTQSADTNGTHERDLLRGPDQVPDPLRVLEDIEAQRTSDPDDATSHSVPIPDLPPGTNTTAALPDTFGTSTWSEQILAAHQQQDSAALARLARAHRPLAWAAHLLALTLADPDEYEQHLVDGYASLADLDAAGAHHEDPRMSLLREESQLEVRLPAHHATATAACTPDGLRLAYAASLFSTLTGPTTDREQPHADLPAQPLSQVRRDIAYAHAISPSPLSTLLSLDIARADGQDLPRYPTRRDDQWSLLYTHAAALHALRHHRDQVTTHLDAARRRLTSHPAAGLTCHLTDRDLDTIEDAAAEQPDHLVGTVRAGAR